MSLFVLLCIVSIVMFMMEYFHPANSVLPKKLRIYSALRLIFIIDISAAAVLMLVYFLL